ERATAYAGERAVDRGGLEQGVAGADVEHARGAEQPHRAALQVGDAADRDQVGAAAGAQLGVEVRARQLGVVAGDGQRADRVARRDGAGDDSAADGANATQATATVDPQRARLGAVDLQPAAVDGRRVGEHAAGRDPGQATVDHGVAQCVVAGQLEHAVGDGQAGKAVVAAQAQPADARLGHAARAADVVGPVVPRLAFPHLGAAGATVHDDVGVDAQLAVALHALAQVHQAPAVELV